MQFVGAHQEVLDLEDQGIYTIAAQIAAERVGNTAKKWVRCF